MRIWSFTAIWIGAAAIMMSSAAAQAERQRPPNVVIFLTDDQGYSDVGCYGAKGFSTPRMDRMASEGMRFMDFYTPAPVCTPTRAGILTGRHPQRLGLDWIENERPDGSPGHVLYSRSLHGLAPDEITIAEVLKERGYATACIGKWHLGDAPEFLPTRQGFDSYLGIPYSNDMIPSILMRDEKVIEEPVDQDSLVERYTEEAVKFMEANRERPFFLYLAHAMPHVPLHVSAKFRGKTERGLYGDVIEALDWSLGRVLDAIGELGLDETTLVIFTSDNGPWLTRGEIGGSARPLRGGKGTTYEGGMRVPFIARWPGKAPAERVSGEVLTQLDLFPTIVRFCGAKMPERKIDGKDFSAVLLGKEGAEPVHEAVFFYGDGNLNAVRSGKWKLKLVTSLREETQYIKYETPETKIPLSLFNLENDPAEQKSVAMDHPEVVEKLRKLAKAQREELGDRRYGVVGTGVREIGSSDYWKGKRVVATTRAVGK
jgi:arylsulfatase A